MSKFNLTISVAIPLEGGVSSPTNCLFEVQVMGIQNAYQSYPKAIGWNGAFYKDQASADNGDFLHVKKNEADNLDNGKKGDYGIGGLCPVADFTFETDTNGDLTASSIDSFKGCVKPLIAQVLDGVEVTDIT